MSERQFRYPIFLDLTGKKCVVTGEGYEIAGKVQALVDAGARVTYVNPRAEAAIEMLAEAGMIEWAERDFVARDLEGCFLVVTHCENNSEVFRASEERNVLCNSVDDPEHCRFSFGSVVRRGDLTIAISTNGVAPGLAVRLRERFAREIGQEYQELLNELKALRPSIIERIPDFSTRRELWYSIIDSAVLDKLHAGEPEAARALLHQLIAEAISSTSRSDTSAGSADR
jgi:precorrin-2 dehydrogenase / sirohydrochlorin ferrochelatase